MVPPFRIKIKPVKLEVSVIYHHQLQYAPFGMMQLIDNEFLQGEINRTTGEAALEFVADFMFTAGPLYKVLCSYVASLVSKQSIS